LRSLRGLGGAAVVAALLTHPVSMAQTEPGASARRTTFILDEYNLDLFAGPHSDRIAGGLSFGTALTNGWWWTAGPRVAFVRWLVDVPRRTGFGVGGTFGAGWRPDRIVSPYAGLALDRDFHVSGTFDWQTVIHAGARIKVTRDPREHYTMTFSVYHADVFGGAGPRGGDTGIAVLYSAVLYAKHR
jgi:hypothetical protein